MTEQERAITEYAPVEWTDETKKLAAQTICKGASEPEFNLFIKVCQRTGLDPFARQIYSVRRKQWNAQTRSYEEAQIIQVSIDGFRLIADRTHKYAGQVGPWWCGPDGEWKEVWLSDEPPAAAKVGVMRQDFHQPLYAIALYKSYVQTNAHGEPVSRWKTDPAGMLAKCAEALALRRAFPQELSGLYTSDEMDKVNADAVNVDWQLQQTLPATEKPTQQPQQPPAEQHEAHAKPKAKAKRPFTPDGLRKAFNTAVATIEAKGILPGPDDYTVTESALRNLLEGERDLERYLEYVTGIPYIEDMSEAHIVALLRLLKPSAVDGTFVPCQEAQDEAAAVIALGDVITQPAETEPAAAEPAPAPASPEITLDEAMAITNSEGVAYGDLTTDKLQLMQVGIRKALEKPGLTDEQRDEYLRKQAAAQLIVNTRKQAQGQPT